MGKRCKENCVSPPSKAYLISFGDTMTALLAFFIVLNSLAEEQTGANMHAGTGSFMNEVDKFGLEGKVKGELSAQAFQQNSMSPKYVVADDEDRPPERGAEGPDDDGDAQRVIDRTKDEYQRFLQQLRQVNSLKQEPDVSGEVSFDIMEPFPPSSAGTLINKELKAALNGVGPMLRRPDYSVEITVWATMPSTTAWTKAVEKAHRLEQETIKRLAIIPTQRSRITAVGRPWISSKVKRPYVSVTVRRLAGA